MTLAIHEMAGLTEAEIRLAIEESAERRGAELDTKLSSHRDDINKRIDKMDDVVSENRDRLADLQTNVALISVDNGRQTKLLEQMVTQGESWHTDDLKFRDDVLVRVSKIETDQTTLTTQVKKLRLIGTLVYVTSRTFRFCLDKCKEAEMWKWIVGAVIIYVLHSLLTPAVFEALIKLVK